MGNTDLTTRSFSLLYKLSEHGKLTPEENQELLENIKEMASTNITARLESKIDAISSKYNALIVIISVIGVAITIMVAIIALK
ncbi:MAG: hypothetical protein OXD43_01065 [Bacteroidetes bacterium]|nr:hypothetical protein [Bacteroidota bacterium]